MGVKSASELRQIIRRFHAVIEYKVQSPYFFLKKMLRITERGSHCLCFQSELLSFACEF